MLSMAISNNDIIAIGIVLSLSHFLFTFPLFQIDNPKRVSFFRTFFLLLLSFLISLFPSLSQLRFISYPAFHTKWRPSPDNAVSIVSINVVPVIENTIIRFIFGFIIVTIFFSFLNWDRKISMCICGFSVSCHLLVTKWQFNFEKFM